MKTRRKKLSFLIFIFLTIVLLACTPSTAVKPTQTEEQYFNPNTNLSSTESRSALMAGATQESTPEAIPTFSLHPTEKLPLSIRQISAGMTHACALNSEGGVKCWGDDTNGQLGDAKPDEPVFVHRSTPVDVIGLSSGVAAISTGGSHTCAMMAAGNVKCWGSNGGGELGDGSTIERHAPVDVATLQSGVAAISAGGSHTCALMSTGGVKCWGSNQMGQLGDGTTTNHNTPVDVVGLTGGVIAVSAGGQETCAITAAGGVKCWGSNANGQLGNGTSENRAIPVDVVGMTSGVSAISVGLLHACAVTSAGSVKCWGGDKAIDTLGNGVPGGQEMPVDVVGITSGALAVSVGGSHTCVLMSSGEVKCWGYDENGQLGDIRGSNRRDAYMNIPVDVQGLPGGVTVLSAGGTVFTCAITPAGGVICWGDNDLGQLGDGSDKLQTAPVDVVNLLNKTEGSAK